ncbi:hypothetical protein TNCV_4502381 [Trichonephila clavipes]|nr:hypothetical protein TNCV_4502381 [Trichonephila clavipes]
MSSRHHRCDFMRGRIIGKDRRRAKKITDVDREFDIANSVVSRLWKSFKTTGMVDGTGGRVRKYDACKDRYIVPYQEKEQAHHSSAGGKTARVFNVSYALAQHVFRSKPHFENVWDVLGRQVAGRNYPPTTKTPHPCTDTGMG